MKKVLITGGAGGIGTEIVKKFAQNNYYVYIIDIDKKSGKNLENCLGKDKCQFIQLDVTNIEQIQSYVNTLNKNFELNHIVTLAGRALENEWISFEKQTLQDIHKSVQLNLLGHLNVIHSFLPFLKNTDGDKSILMVSSINATDCFGLPAYSASKSGLYGFKNATVNEFGLQGIRINTLSPGTVITEATQKEPKDFTALLKGSALGKFTTSKDVANLAFNICDTYVTMTGQDIVLDAGQTKMHNF